MNKEELLQEIKNQLISDGNLYDIVRSINSINDHLSDLDYWENGEDFFETFFTGKIDEAVRAACYGDYTYTDQYVIINAYGNLDTLSDFELQNLLEENIDEIVEELLDIWQDEEISDVHDKARELIEQYFESEN